MPRVARLAIKFNVQSNRSVVILARGRARLSRRIWFCQVLSVVYRGVVCRRMDFQRILSKMLDCFAGLKEILSLNIPTRGLKFDLNDLNQDSLHRCIDFYFDYSRNL